GRSRAGTSIRILCALQKKNLFDFREMFRLFKSLPGVTFSLVPVFQYDAAGAYFKEVIPKPADVARLRTEIDHATATAESQEEKDFYRSWRNAADGWMDTERNAEPQACGGSCTIPWYSTYIDAKGRVYPCCYLTETDHVMGNIRDRPFPEVWRGERYQ